MNAVGMERYLILSFCFLWLLSSGSVYGYSPSELDNIDPQDVCGQGEWLISPSEAFEQVGDKSNSDRSLYIPTSVKNDISIYLGPSISWKVLRSDEKYYNGTSGSQIVWIQGYRERTIVLRILNGKWLLLSGNKGLAKLSDALSAIPNDSFSTIQGGRVHLYELLQLHAARSLEHFN